MHTVPVTIYLADTGMDPRPEFGNRVIANINFSTGLNGLRNPNDYTDHGLRLDDVWHGTTTAVVAAGAQNGVAKWAKIANVRVLTGAQGTYDDIVAGIDWITQQRLARPSEYHIGNASFGGTAVYPPAEDAFRRSVGAGVAWIFGAANDSADACSYSPARLGRELSGAITVGAMNPANDTVYAYSNQGPCVEIFAPSEVEWGDPGGTVAGGTSAAAPHVAGVFAIRWAYATAAPASEIEGMIKGAATMDVLKGLWTSSPNLLLHSLLPKRRS